MGVFQSIIDVNNMWSFWLLRFMAQFAEFAWSVIDSRCRTLLFSPLIKMQAFSKLCFSSLSFMLKTLLIKLCNSWFHTPYANMADNSVVARDELRESEASCGSVICFDNASPEKSCFFDDLVSFISPCLGVFVFTSKAENIRSMQFVGTKEVRSRSPREVKFVRYVFRLEDLRKSFKWRAFDLSGGVPTRFTWPVPDPR